jgi:epoxyqueuosine reductase
MPLTSTDIKIESRRLGFQLVGIARAEVPVPESGHLTGWLERGYQADMAWMDRTREKRSDPAQVLPGVRSIVSVAMNYQTPFTHSHDSSAGKISRYAWGDDYHTILQEKLSQLLEWIRQRDPGAEGRVYVDTGPVMEKAWAQRAGIGWIGKHTNVITREFGSWVFLGEILLNRELEYDTPATDHCGTCTLCLDACPTRALVEPYVLDAGRCISFQTIENKGPIPDAIGKDLDRWIFGCDICQDVCPWNIRFAVPTEMKEFEPREHALAPDLKEIGEMTPEEFRRRFAGSPVLRTKLSGLVRNAETVLKHSTIDYGGTNNGSSS